MSTSTPDLAGVPTSLRFRAEDADVIFQSVDGVQYHIHRKNLQCCAAAFPPDEFESDKQEIIHLTETSRCLDLLFAFMYPQSTPDVRNMPIEVVIELAEASEKYQASSVMTVCRLTMIAMANNCPGEILQYAAVHDDHDLVDLAAAVAIAKPLDTVVSCLSPNIALAWVRYYQKWRDSLTSLQNGKRYGCPCQNGKMLRLEVLDRMGSGVHVLRDMEDVFYGLNITGCCCRVMGIWRADATRISEFLVKFSKYLPMST